MATDDGAVPSGDEDFGTFDMDNGDGEKLNACASFHFNISFFIF
jgi:hypothetical protein